MPRRARTVMACLAAVAALGGCGETSPDVSPSPTPLTDAQLELEGLRAGFVEGLVLTAPRITQDQADCAFDEAVARGVTFEDFVAIETSPELEARFAAAFAACGIS